MIPPSKIGRASNTPLIATRKHADYARGEEKHHTDANKDGYYAPYVLHGFLGIAVEEERHKQIGIVYGVSCVV